jgi:hypothetical protein
MSNWKSLLNYDPIPMLMNSNHKAIPFFTQRDLLQQNNALSSILWELPHPQKILRKQLPNGAWPRTAANKHPAINVELIETWRNLRFLIDMYEFDSSHPQIMKAVEFVFSTQSKAGDFRGFLANQYATYYTGALLSLIIKAGYQNDPRTDICMKWLLSMRQYDGGWTIPMITHKLSKSEQYQFSSEYYPPLELDRNKPFSHNWTGMVLRAFAAHPDYRLSPESIHAANLLCTRFFEKDAYTSYQNASYWQRFEFPFWWNNLVAAMDTISVILPQSGNSQIKTAIQWFIDNQNPDGTWKYTYVPGKYRQTSKGLETNLWITLSICRTMQRLFSES